MGSRISLRCSAPRMATTTSWLIRPIMAAVHHEMNERARCRSHRAAECQPDRPGDGRSGRQAAPPSPDLPRPHWPAAGQRHQGLSTTQPCKSGTGKSSTDWTSQPQAAPPARSPSGRADSLETEQRGRGHGLQQTRPGPEMSDGSSSISQVAKASWRLRPVPAKPLALVNVSIQLFTEIAALLPLLERFGVATDIEFDGPEGLLVPPDRRLSRHHQPLGRVEEVQGDSLVGFDRRRCGGEGLRELKPKSSITSSGVAVTRQKFA